MSETPYMDLRDERDQLKADLLRAKDEAESLCIAIYNRYHKESVPQFELCDSVAGVISQIDNMVAGLCNEIAQFDNVSADIIGSVARHCAEMAWHSGDRENNPKDIYGHVIYLSILKFYGLKHIESTNTPHPTRG